MDLASPRGRLPSACATSFRRGRPERGGSSWRFAVEPAFGPNPGRLRLRTYVPDRPLRPGAPLVVLLHGCGQDAGEFAEDAGWMALADRLGAPLLLPEQMEANNRHRCFQWFHLAHTRRGHGEAASIAAMVSAMAGRWQSDPRRVFVAGLSAGGAMAAAMLAAYPDLFAAGAVFAGLPVGSATSMAQALARMAHAGPDCSPADRAEQARRMAPAGYAKPWPRLSVWHGEADRVVLPENGRNLAAQWCALHGIDATPTRQAACCRAWGDAVEHWTLPGLGHAWAIGAPQARAVPFIAPGPVDAVTEIARFWRIG